MSKEKEAGVFVPYYKFPTALGHDVAFLFLEATFSIRWPFSQKYNSFWVSVTQLPHLAPSGLKVVMASSCCKSLGASLPFTSL